MSDEDDCLSSQPPPKEDDDDSGARRDSLREANRTHCKQTRERKKRREQLLHEELEVLTLCKAIVEHGPDLFSVHRVDQTAPFSFLCENFYQRLQVEPEDILGQSLETIVDPRDRHILQLVVLEVINNRFETVGRAKGAEKGAVGGRVGRFGGSLVHLRVTSHGLTCQASMTMVVGTQGLIVVTRLYGA